MKKHKNIRSKMKKIGPLFLHPIVSQHVPETVWYNPANCKNMLLRHGSIYIKPDTGRQGNRIVRVTKINPYHYQLAGNDFFKIISLSGVLSELENMISQRTYIIQQRIDLATYRNCPFDIRMVMQKPYNTWQLTLTSAKVALSEDAVVTNVSKGAEDYPLIDILQNYDQREDAMATLKRLVDLAHQVSYILGAKFPFRVIGLDMAVDKKGNLWFIEANTRPQCDDCKLVNDDLSQNLFINAKKIIGYNHN